MQDRKTRERKHSAASNLSSAPLPPHSSGPETPRAVPRARGCRRRSYFNAPPACARRAHRTQRGAKRLTRCREKPWTSAPSELRAERRFKPPPPPSPHYWQRPLSPAKIVDCIKPKCALTNCESPGFAGLRTFAAPPLLTILTAGAAMSAQGRRACWFPSDVQPFERPGRHVARRRPTTNRGVALERRRSLAEDEVVGPRRAASREGP